MVDEAERESHAPRKSVCPAVTINHKENSIIAQSTPRPVRSNPSPQEELAALISAASKQPGVQELMQVYRQSKPFEAAMQLHQRYVGIHRVTVVSNSSAENILQGK